MRGIGITFGMLEKTSQWNTKNVRYLLYYHLLCVGQFKKKNKNKKIQNLASNVIILHVNLKGPHGDAKILYDA